MSLLWIVTVWACGGAAAILLLALPELALHEFELVALPSFVHLITLGTVLSVHYAQQAARWRGEHLAHTRGQRVFALLVLGIWALHASGVATFVWGMADLREDGGWAAYLGGHYLIPTAIGLSMLTDVARSAFRGRLGLRAPQGPVWRVHLPAFGLLLAMSLGVMLLLDRVYGDYGFYGLPQIGLHALAAAFLFVLPVLDPANAGSAADRASMAGAHAPPPGPVLAAGFGLCFLAVDYHAFGSWFLHGVTVSLIWLGVVALWVGLPPPSEWERAGPWLRRLPWAILGLLLMETGLLSLNGAELAEGLPQAWRAGSWFLVGLAAPGAMAWALRVFRDGASLGAPAPGPIRLPLVAQMVCAAGGLALLGAEWAESALAVRGAIALWAAGWGLFAVAALRMWNGSGRSAVR